MERDSCIEFKEQIELYRISSTDRVILNKIHSVPTVHIVRVIFLSPLPSVDPSPLSGANLRTTHGDIGQVV